MAIKLLLIFSALSQSVMAMEMSGKSFRSLSIDLMSWQQEGAIKASNAKSKITTTNMGYCAGGSWGKKTEKFRNFIDGCFFYASGNVGAENSVITYDEKNISASGLKLSFGSGMFVSQSRAEIGFKIPLMYANQNLTEPNGAKLKEPNPLIFMGSVYSRWPFSNLFLQTEFSKIIGNDLTLFSIGAGYEF